MTTIDELVKKFDNIYPVKEIKVSLLSNDGTSKVRTFFDIDYNKAARIRETMTYAERERQRSML